MFWSGLTFFKKWSAVNLELAWSEFQENKIAQIEV